MSETHTQDQNPDASKVTNSFSLLAFSLQLALKSFGPYAFGLVSVMILYFGLFKPQIDALIARDQARDDVLKTMVDNSLQATKAAERASEDSKTATENSRATAAIMERILSNVTQSNRE